ncbi:MAG: hypothetical protein FWG54_04850 [Bacteroidetes bacterium]|nr:hypothetical protein [Bacteroidota bacterium]
MKKILASFLFLFTCLWVFAQECTTMWPYLYSDFTEGKVYFKSGKSETRFLNIHVYANKLHFIDGENICELIATDNISKVEIAKDAFVPLDGSFYQLLAQGNPGIYFVLLISGDFKSLYNDAGAYGSSSNSASTQKLSSIELGRFDGNMNHMNLKNNKDAGKDVPLLKKYFFISGMELIPARAKEVEKSLTDAAKKKEFNAFVKANKINWKKPEDLAKVLTLL